MGQSTFLKEIGNQGFLVQFSNASSARLVLDTLAKQDLGYASVYLPYHIYLLNDISEAQLQSFQEKGYLVSYQKNRKIERRTKVPNDEHYPLQWSMKQIGMEKLWSIGTGGVTKRGDTVVVAIIDAGFDTSHPDFGNNLWLNRFEISEDTIDNDGNGYPGDYYGWNAISNRGRIMDAPEFAVHGMPLAGIIGAVGDNMQGMAGIAWQNKFMVVVGGLFESDAIASYGYVLSQKKRYLNSNGDSGAYVVAANTSWGRSAFPDDTPIWCAMYDSLGVYGILNLTSVDNRNVDVAIAGDIPTLCPSPFIVSITSSNKADQIGGGYSKDFVAMTAPGSGIFSAASSVRSRLYEDVNGTSFASPHATGVVSLLYSLACDSFVELAHRSPDSGALWMKNFLIKGVDKLSHLTQYTISGGRLNAFKSYQYMQAWCEGKDSIVDTLPQPPVKDTPTIFSLYPNPGEGTLYIAGPLTQLKEIQWYAVTGALVATTTLKEGLTDFDVLTLQTQLSPGVYYIKGISTQGEIIFKQKWISL